MEALQEEVIGYGVSKANLDFAYLNNATTSYPKCKAAVDAFSESMAAPPSDVRHSDTPDIEVARGEIAKILQASVDTVFFAADATLAINMVIRGVLRAGGRALVDNRAHNAITRTLHNAGNIDWSVLDLYDAQDALRSTTINRRDEGVSLVCLTHTSNVTGSIFDLSSVIQLAREALPNAKILIDASQSAGVTSLLDLQLGDFAVFPAHKHLHAIPGAAVVIAKSRLSPVIFGGTGTHSAILSLGEYGSNLVEVGTPNIPAIKAMSAALLDWKKNAAVYRQRIDDLVERLWTGLSEIDGLTLLGRGPGRPRTGIISVSVAKGLPEQEWVRFLRQENVVVRGGLHCSPIHHEQLGLGKVGSLRFSVSRFTTDAEIEMALASMRTFARTLAVLDA